MRLYGSSLLGLAMASVCVMASPRPEGRRSASFFLDEYPLLLRGANYPHPGYRSRGKQAKPRKRPNRRHISRRVRRAHRRSRAA